MNDIFSILNGLQVVAIVCNQWGDTGKGKFTHLFGEWADVIVRGTGGANAGHTVVLGGKEVILHLVPTSMLYNSPNKISVLGNGMVIDPEALCHELDDLAELGFTEHTLLISQDAHVIMPYHVEYDKAKNLSQAKGGVGSTGRGIGPCYTDKAARRGIKMGEIFNADVLVKKISKAKPFYPEIEIDVEQILSWLRPFTERLKPYVADTIREMQQFLRQGKKILLEGAQGLLLSCEYGTYHYVTSSECSINGTATGAGLSARDVDLTLGIVKFPFLTRVGAGPFPTELGGIESEKYCAAGVEHDIFYEVKEFLKMDLPLSEIRELQSRGELGQVAKYKQQVHQFLKANRDLIIDLCNSNNPLLQGVGIRLAAKEYGATTARPRRIGWEDAVAVKYAVSINGPNFILTKTDCPAGINEFNICYGYKINGQEVTEFSRDPEILRQVKPTYTPYSGYDNILENLPDNLGKAIKDFEKFTGGRTRLISFGAEPEETILVNK